MPYAIAMPKLGMTMQEGTVVEWRVPPGERVTKGQVVLSIESEKAEVEIESPADGVLRHVYVQPGETVPCGTLLAALTETPDEPFDPQAFRQTIGGGPRRDTIPGSPREPRHPVVSQPRGLAVDAAAQQRAAPVTPAARRRAQELDIDPARVSGSGPGGRVMREDIEAYAAVLAARVAVADGIALEVPTQGEGTPVLLLPGFGTDVSAFARQVPALAQRYQTRGVNPRGVGFSDAPEAERYDISTAAADAAVVAGGPAHVIGASLGAAVALELALRHPECVRSLILITPFVRAGARLRSVIDAWCGLAAEAAPETLARALVPWLFSETFLADDIRRQRAVRALMHAAARVPSAALSRWAAGLHAWSGTRAGDLGHVSVPTLIIASGQDLLTPGAVDVADAVPNARAVVIPGAGHAVALEAPDAVSEALCQHLAASDT